MIKDIIKGASSEYTIDYMETDENLTEFNWYPYDFYIINWHPHTLAIKKELLDKMTKPKIAIVVEVGTEQYIPFTPDWFDAYAIIDPTKVKNGKFSEEKRFYELVDAANNSGLDSIVRVNLPAASFTYTSITDIVNYGKKLEKRAGPKVEVIISHDYMDRDTLVAWLSQHTMNCFPYYRERPGLSAVTDQAISAGRAIMTTECNTFRHLHKYIEHSPKQSYIELAESTLSGVKQMRIDWSPEMFRKEFDSMLRELRII